MPNWNHIVREHLAVLRLPPEREIEIVEEQALHLEAAYEDALADGLSEAEAETRALRSYDWRLLECELSRAERPVAGWAMRPSPELIERKGGMRMESFIQDLRFGARMLVKNPGFTLIAVLTLALGIGANTAIFSVINATLIRPLPYPNASRLVMVWESRLPDHDKQNVTSPATFLNWQRDNNVFEAMSISFNDTGILTGETGLPEQIAIQDVSPNLFSLLGVNAAMGRVFVPAQDGSDGGDQVAILS